MITNIPAPGHLDKLPFAVFFFFSKTNERKMEPTLIQTQFQFSKDIQCHKGKRIVTMLLVFDRINFFNMVHLHFDFTFNGKPL